MHMVLTCYFDGRLVNMYIGSMFESEIWFTASLSGVSVNLPHNVRIIGDTSFHNGSSYVISIKNNLAVSVCYA